MASPCRSYNSLKYGLRPFLSRRFPFNSSLDSKAFVIRTSSSSTEILPFTNIPGNSLLSNLKSFVFGDGMYRLHLHEQESRLKYGPIFRLMWVPGMKSVYVCDPDIVQQVYRSESQYPKRDPEIPIFSKYKKDRGRDFGIFFSYGETWYKARTAFSGKMLKTKEVAEYSGLLQSVARDFVTSLTELKTGMPDNTVPKLHEELFKWSLESFGTVIFEKRVGLFDNPPSQKAQDLIQAVHSITANFFNIMYYPAWAADYYKPKGIRDFYDWMDVLYNFVEAAVEARATEINNSVKTSIDGTHVDLLTTLIGNQSLPLEKITDNLVDILFASIDSTSITTLWTLYSLAKNPEAQARLHDEVVSVLKPGEIPTPNKINQMHYLRACIIETLRLYPAAVNNTRIFDEDLTLMGYNIPKGTLVVIPLYVMGRDPDLFDDPDAYKPERWMRGDQAYVQHHPFAFLPFGHGVRMCIGRRIVMLEMSLLLSTVVQKFHLESMVDVGIVIKGIPSPDKDPNIKFTERSSSA